MRRQPVKRQMSDLGRQAALARADATSILGEEMPEEHLWAWHEQVDRVFALHRNTGRGAADAGCENRPRLKDKR